MIRTARGIHVGIAAACLAVLGCGGSAEKATLYRVDKLIYEAHGAEVRARLGTETPDSAALLGVREQFLKIRQAVPGDLSRFAKQDEGTPGYKLFRAVANSEAQGIRLALQARRPDLALEAALRLKENAAGEPATARQAAFLALTSYQALRRYDDAIAEMKSILKRFPPSETPAVGEDPILSLPETIVTVKRSLGDEAGAKSEMHEALAYYESILHDPLPAPVLAQARARALVTALDLDMERRALAHADTMEMLVAARPELRSMLAEVQFARAKIRTKLDPDPTEGIVMLQRLATNFPGSPFASRALFEAATQLESARRYPQALEAYGVLLQRFPNAPEVAPISLYRVGLVQERLGRWDDAKSTLEQVPVRYPKSQAAAEAPMAILGHYSRGGRLEAAKQYFPKAIETYRGLIERDANGQYAPLFRARLFLIYDAAGDSTAAYGVVEEMARLQPRHPITAQLLLAGGRIATKYGNVPRGAGYLNLFLQQFPNSPVEEEVRRELKEHGY